MKRRAALFPFIVGGLAFVCFLLVALWMSTAVQPLWGRIPVLLLPSIVLCTIGVLAGEGVLSAEKTTVLTGILTAVLLLLSVFYTFLLTVWTATTVTTDPKYYERAYHQIESRECVKDRFPAHIPEDAQDVTFFYMPQFLQGGEEFRLSYCTTEDQMEEWTQRLEACAEWIGSNAEWHQQNNWGFSGSDSVRYHLYWDGGFNHGEECCVLVEPDTCRMEFCYSCW